MKLIALTAILFMVTASNLFGQSVRVALVQSAFEWADVQANIDNFGQKVGSIEGCDVVILPELFTSGCDMSRRDKGVKDAEKSNVAAHYDDVVAAMKKWAQQSNAVIIGSTIFKENKLFFNRLIAAYPNGKVLHYDKHNCFKHGSFSPGGEHLVIDVKGHRFATYICYDLRFEEWSRNEGRYQSAIYVANWPSSRAEDWDRLLRERAIENEAYVVGVNCVGVDPAGIQYMGNSSVISPSGELMAACRGDEQEILIVEY
ncbi:MAG: nitrilase-related carbon-nitrogen hydrolase [Rikenellaceae bacterium]